jgi:hypothetical protein
MNTHEHIVEGGCTNQPPGFPKPRTNHDPNAPKPRTSAVGTLFSWIRRLVRWPPSGPKSE